MLVQSNVQRLFSVDEVIVLLEENTAWNPKFYYGRFKLADKDGSECKANLIRKNNNNNNNKWSARVSLTPASN